MWADAECPPPSEPSSSPAWGRWSERVGQYLKRLDEAFSVWLSEVGGSGSGDGEGAGPQSLQSIVLSSAGRN